MKGRFLANMINCSQHFLREKSPHQIREEVSKETNQNDEKALSLFVDESMASESHLLPQYFAWKVIAHSSMRDKVPFFIQFMDFDRESGKELKKRLIN